jgi:hypothetical protein
MAKDNTQHTNPSLKLKKNNHRSSTSTATKRHACLVYNGRCPSIPPLLAMPHRCHPSTFQQGGGILQGTAQHNGDYEWWKHIGHNLQDTPVSLEVEDDTFNAFRAPLTAVQRPLWGGIHKEGRASKHRQLHLIWSWSRRAGSEQLLNHNVRQLQQDHRQWPCIKFGGGT